MSRDTRIYVGNLPSDVSKRDLEDLFHKYGDIKDIDLKNRRTPYAFLDYYDHRDADDAVRGRHNYNYDGYRLKVEKTRGSGRYSGNGGHGGHGGRSFGGGHYVQGRPAGPPSKRTNYRVFIEGLPTSGSWQDLKDHMREAGDVCYADVYRDGTGVVEYGSYDDVKHAVKHLNDTKFVSHERETSYIRVRDDSRRSRSYSSSRSRSRSESRSRSRSKRRSPSYSPKRSRSKSPRSRSPSKSRSKSRSRSRSRT